MAGRPVYWKRIVRCPIVGGFIATLVRAQIDFETEPKPVNFNLKLTKLGKIRYSHICIYLCNTFRTFCFFLMRGYLHTRIWAVWKRDLSALGSTLYFKIVLESFIDKNHNQNVDFCLCLNTSITYKLYYLLLFGSK